MDITFIADTHGLHNELKLLPGSVLIHAGDITEYGTEEEVVDFLSWFSWQPFEHKIFIGGNHDLYLEECISAKRKKLLPPGVTYLQNTGVDIEGFKIWGSPFTPYFLGMAFNARAGREIKTIWNKIPHGIDILITHGPPEGILDGSFGCKDLLARVTTIQPLVHCFGHAHGQNGMVTRHEIRFINASMVNSADPLSAEEYRIIGKPLLLKF